ncbi:MAG: SpoIID/LytB domain-containing protein [Clostridia bacterium]|nr:SpoIID/LytB domain-containing protein [Clostridia bacterium]
MKKMLSICFIFTFLFTLINFTSVSALDPKYETVKVGLYYSSSAKTNLTLASDTGFQLGYMQENTFVPLYSMAETSLSLAYSSNASLMINGTLANITNGNIAFVSNSGVLSLDGAAYRGGIELVPTAENTFTVINFVNINDYIASVVGKEMSPSWNIEALKAQAVCARSYTISTFSKHSSLGFNLCATQDCQVYKGISGESEKTVQAAHETKDQVLTYEGNVASTLYSSSNGGSTAYSKNVWGNDVPYLTAKLDIHENPAEISNSPWQIKLTNEEIKEKLAQNGIDIGDVYDMEVTGADEFGRTYKVTIYGTKGSFDLVNDKTRTFFGLRSQKYSITDSKTNTAKLYAKGSGEASYISSYNCISSTGIKEAPAQIGIQTVSGIKSYSIRNASISDGTYLLDGTGWGHGLGMSQWGAKAMADKGFLYTDILDFYYTGTTLE